ncbi:MAG: hypothetical protein KKF74_01655 [Nanoarchaeota archaeon]|nr:hypothetical protein [Nanoarchaeota archaeon]
MKLKLILLIIVILALANQSYALGIAPSHIDVIFEPSLEKTIQLKVINNAYKDFDAVVYAEGALAEYIIIDEPMIKLTKDQDSKIISYKIKLPQSLEKQGLHEASIVVREIPKDTKGGTTVTANLAVVSKLKVMVPYKGKYAEIKLFVTNFKQNQESNFAVEVINLGTEDILEAKAVIDIYGPLNNKLATTTSNKFQINSKNKEILIAKWTPEIGPGNYHAVATLIYDELNTKDEKSFTIGTLQLEIVSISVTDFRLGGIAKFDILVENNWNTEIPNVYTETTVEDNEGKIYTQFKTASVNMPAFGKQELNAYWDTAKVIPGAYKFNIVLNYLDQKTEKIFDIMVEYDRITATLAGQVIGLEGEEKPTLVKSVYILIFLVLILIIFNVVIYFKKVRK